MWVFRGWFDDGLTIAGGLCTLVVVALIAAPAEAQYLYATNNNTSDISGYDIDASSGALSLLASSPFASGSNPQVIVVDPSGTHLYAPNESSNDVTALSIDQSTGALSAVGPPVGTNDTGPSIAVMNPDGTRLYVTNAQHNTVSVFDIDQPTGALSLTGFSPVVVTPSAGPVGIAMNGDGTELYVLSDASQIRVFDINQSTGNLSQITGSPYSTGANPQRLTISPDHAYLYVTTLSPDRIYGYSIDQSTGALTDVPGSFVASDGSAPRSLAVTPDGTRLYVGNAASENLSAYNIDQSTGVLSQVVGSPFGVLDFNGCGPWGLNIDPSGTRLYAGRSTCSGVHGVSAFDIDPSTGALSSIAGSPFAANGTTPGTRYTAIAPAQAPTAAFTAAPSASGPTVSFDASASTAHAGAIGTYDWDFGDGHPETTTLPQIAHTYDVGGTYTVTLTAADLAGCSATPVWAGNTAYCNGGSSAETTAEVTVANAPSSATPTTEPPASPAASRLAIDRLTANAHRVRASRLHRADAIVFQVGLAHVPANTDVILNFDVAHMIWKPCRSGSSATSAKARCKRGTARLKPVASFKQKTSQSDTSVALPKSVAKKLIGGGAFAFSATATADGQSSEAMTTRLRVKRQ